MSDATLYERPYTGAYDEAVFAFVVAHPEPGPTYAEIQALLFPPAPPQPIVPREIGCGLRSSSPAPYVSTSSYEPSSGYLFGLPLGIALGMMF